MFNMFCQLFTGNIILIFFNHKNETGTYCVVAMSGNEQCLGEIVFHWSSTKSERLTVIY